MAVLVVGADRLGNIYNKLCSEMDSEIIHWKGRCNSCSKKCRIPKNVTKIIVFYDFINHNLMKHIKRHAKKSGVSIKFSRRALSNLDRKLLA